MSLYKVQEINPAGPPKARYWVLKKFDDDFNYVGTYEIHEGKCNCPAATKWGHRYKPCRHVKLVKYMGRVLHNTGQFFDWDNFSFVEREGIDANEDVL